MNQLRDRMAIQPLHDIPAVSLGRLYTDLQRCGYFFAGLSFRQKLHDLPLPGGQPQTALSGAFPRARGIFPQIPFQNNSKTIWPTFGVKNVLFRSRASTADTKSRLASDF